MKMKKILAMAMAALLLVAVSVAGTVAYLQDATDPVVNTFSPTNIDVTLTETKPGANGGSAQVIPGVNIEKDPKVTATATEGVAYWVFVDVIEAGWFEGTEEDGVTRKVAYEIDTTKWTLLGANDNGALVYYAAVANGGNFEANVLKNNVVTVSSSLTDEEMASLTTMGSLTFKAYAIQQNAMTGEAAAYNIASGNTITTPAN